MDNDIFAVKRVRAHGPAEAASEAARGRLQERESFLNSLPRNERGGFSVRGRDFSDLPDWVTREQKFRLSDLRETDWTGRNLSGTDFSMSRLDAADLSGANLRETVWTDTRAERANLRSADLRGARLDHTYLPGADLRETVWTGAFLGELTCLNGADLRGARGLEAVKFPGDGPGKPRPGRPWPASVHWNEETRWPIGFSPDGGKTVGRPDYISDEDGTLCTVCNNPALAEINAALAAGESVRAIETRFGVSKSSVARHKNHLEP
jgi:hypothetical protein